MRIACLGGGPAGLYFSILLKKKLPDAEIELIERNAADVTFGWGVVFSEETLGYLTENDPVTADLVQAEFAHWTDIEIRTGGRSFISGGHGFCGIMRKRLLQILQERARSLGVKLSFSAEFPDERDYLDRDLVVACDGANSGIRKRHAEHFGTSIDLRRNKYIWFGASWAIPNFLFSFRRNEHGLFWVHAYPFDGERSTFIIECSNATHAAAGLDKADEAASVAYCEALFAEDLAGARLMSNRASWINFPMIRNTNWRLGNMVLIGDAAHTAHFSIGSGTKLAMEDAIALANAVAANPSDVPAALEAYETGRRPDVERLQKAAQESLVWFENIERYRDFDPLQFAFACLNRSKRVSHSNLGIRDPGFVEQVDRLVVDRAAAQTGLSVPATTPPMFTPFRLRGMMLENRVVVSPMCQYSAIDGMPDDWQMVHLGSRAVGGAGLVFTEMTDVSAEARITPGCTGIWNREQAEGWKRIVSFVHDRSRAKIALQLGHAGRKGSTRLMWEGMDKPLPDGNWPILSPSPIPYAAENQVPHEITRVEMDRVIGDFARAAELAKYAGFDMVEVHMAHGYLLSCFITPLANRRTDEYGGSIENRMRFPLEVFDAVRAVWPEDKPVSARVSATDWHENGLSDDDRVAVARMLKAHGCDVVDVSAGQTVADARPVYGRAFQTPFSDEIRNAVGIATISVGNIVSWDDINSIVAGGRADLCALARPHLADPYWTLHAAAEQGYDAMPWPVQYQSAKPRPRK